jgi:hypothetical protein
MNERFVKRHGKICLLIAFLFSAAISGCNWRDEGAPAFERMTVFENASDAPVLLYIDTRIVSEIEGKLASPPTRGAHLSAGRKIRPHHGRRRQFSAGGYITSPMILYLAYRLFGSRSLLLLAFSSSSPPRRPHARLRCTRRPAVLDCFSGGARWTRPGNPAALAFAGRRRTGALRRASRRLRLAGATRSTPRSGRPPRRSCAVERAPSRCPTTRGGTGRARPRLRLRRRRRRRPAVISPNLRCGAAAIAARS